MNALESVAAHCPYCGQPIELLVECTGDTQRYIEDCAVCCRPIDISVRPGVDSPSLHLRRQDDA